MNKNKDSKPRYTVPRQSGKWPGRGEPAPGLSGVEAWRHPAARQWREWARSELSTSAPTVLLTPCSNVKPYPKSPQSAKIRGVLRRLGLWDPAGRGYRGEPRGIEWLYLSDLLGLVPYWRAHEYPACCYEFPPQALDGSLPLVTQEIRGVLRGFLERNRPRVVVAYLPRFYRGLAGPVLERAASRVVWVSYHLFRGHRMLEEALREVLGDGVR